MSPRKTKAHEPSKAPTKPPKAPIVTVRAHPIALSLALEIAGGDRRRLVVEAGGSVLVKNPT